MISLNDWIQRLHRVGQRRFPSIFGRVTRRDVEEAEAHLEHLTEEELAEGLEAARRAIATARVQKENKP